MICLNLGKIGDTLSLLPILHSDYKATGKKPTLIISKEYAPILGRIDYITPHIWDGDWQDLRSAIIYAKKRFDNVIVPQIFGKDFPIAKFTPSFQLDQWLRAGKIDYWDRLPLVLPRPKNSADILKAHLNGKPVILYADHSQSSPFSKKDDLYRLLVDYLGQTHQILRLSEVRLPNPLDLLALFDAADCLVTVETMMLHLSAASTVPTIALVADSPTRWKGSAWSKRFLLHVRYVDYENRKDDIIRAVKRAVNKSSVPKLETIQTEHFHAYNPSIAEHEGKVWVTYRFHPDPKSWRTDLAITDGKSTWKIEVPRFQDHSLEDMRLFEHDGKLHGSFTIAKSGDEGFSPCVTAYGELVFSGQRWSVQNLKIPKYKDNDFSGQSKNWVLFSNKGKLHAIYKMAKEHVVLELDGDAVTKEYRTPTPECSYGSLRGGTQPFPYKGQLLRFCHALQRNDKTDQWWSYHLVALLMEPDPPFRITKISEQPILSGTEQYFHGWPRCKPRVLIPYGAVRHGNGWKVAVGVNDSACATVNLEEKDLAL